MEVAKRITKLVGCLMLSVMMVFTLIPGLSLMDTAYAATGSTPPHTKNITDNQDGTYTISLDIVGESEKKPNNVNVLVIFDTSGSMTQQRMTAAKNAVNSLANSLSTYNTESAPDTVEMALVRFATTSRIAQQPTNNLTTFRNTVSGLGNQGSGGTNWEAALQTAMDVDFNDDDQTFVIFVSDGNPTFRTDRNGYNDQYQTGVYGTGQETPQNIARCYATAVDDAQALATKVTPANFFTIGAFGNVDRMEQLTDDAGSDSDTNYYSAQNTAALNQAISDILAKIEMAGFADAEVTDGTTNQVTTTSGEVAELLELVPNFKYYRSGGSYGTMQEWADAPTAKIVNGEVEWDLSSVGVLENGVKYTVTFDCYPSQETYDTIAKLKNGDITYNSLDSEIKKYIVDNGGGSYSLRTNTNAGIAWDDTRDDAGRQTSGYTNPDPVGTDAETLTATKKWEGGEADVDSLEMTVLMDDEEFHTATMTKTGGWTTSSFISIGIIKGGQVLPGAEGHDFKFAELDDTQYHWELETPTVHPMLIDGVKTMLVKVDKNHPVPSGADTYTIDGATYYVDKDAAGLTATNHRRSNLNLTKVVTGEDAPKDATFPFTLSVNNPKAPTEEPSSTDDPNHNSDYWLWFSIYDTKAGATVMDATVSGTGLVGPNSDGYYYLPSKNSITVQMKDGWNLRFLNLPSSTTYTFTEGTLAEGFAFNKAELTQGEDSTFSGGQTTKGKIENTKTSYTVKYTNDYALTNLEITKVWDDADNQDGKRLTADELKAKLTLNPAVEGKEPSVNDNGDGTYTITYTGLPRFNNGEEVTYKVTESEIDGYTTTGSPAEDHGTITNKHVPELTKAKVVKVWEDNNDQDGKRPTSLTVTLNADGEATETTATLNADNEWTFETDKTLPKYKAGKEITYIWTEDETKLPEGYELTGTSVDGNTTTLTNTYEPETTTASVLKVWNDNEDQDGKRPGSLTVTLYADGTATETTVTLNDNNKWTDTVENLPMYRDGGTKIEYTWQEDESALPEGYELDSTSTTGTLTTITNKYEPETIDIPVEKVWEDYDNRANTRPSTITVNLMDGDTKVDSATFDAGEDGSWSYTFTGKPKYKDGGTEIKYTVTEEAVPKYETSIDGTTITNTYEAKPVTAQLEATKDITGYPEDGPQVTFTFELVDAEGTVVDTQTVTLGNGKTDADITFEELEFEDPDTYKYTIRESAGSDAGWTYDDTEYGVTIEVTDDGSGQLQKDVTYDNGPAAFLNTYKAKPAEVTLGGTKTLEGRPTPMKAKEFSFVLKDEEGKQVGTATNDANGKYAFDALSFDKAGTYKYTIDEIDTGVPGVTYGMKTYNVVITVTDPGDGQLVAAIGGDLNAQGDNADYTNTYKATPTSITLEGDKTLVGRDLKAGEFEFTITGDKPLPAETSVKNNAKGEFSFGEIEYTEAGIYTYTVAETEGSDECITYTDKTYTVVVTVSDDSEGKLHATKEIKEGNSLSFVNKYKGKPGEATIVGEKIIKNYKALEGGEYEFTISGEYAPLPGTEEQPSEEQPAVDDTQNDNNTEAKEAAVEQAKEDAVEANEAVDEAKEALVEAQVADDEAEVKAAEEDLEKAEAEAEEAEEDVKAAEEALEEAGGEAGDTVKAAADDEEEATDVEVPLPDPATVENDENGVVNFGTLTFAEEGIYTYKITESGSLPGVTNDPDNEKTVVVTVKDNKEGKMVATVEPSGALQFTFTNTYTPPPTPSSITDQIPVTKEFVGHSLKDGDFTFVLTDEDGKVLAEATNKADGSVEFPAITFYEAGTYTYKVYEKEGSSDAITYDKTVYTATATVTDDYDGEDMEIEWTFEGGDAINFVNTWDDVVYIDPPVQKVVKGNPKKDETFTFKLEAQNPEDPMPEAAGGDSSMTMTIKGSGTKEFGEIEFTEPGEYVYKVTEVAGSNPDYKYDGTVYHVKAVVTEDDDYNLHVKSVYYKDGTEVDTAVFKFVNTYEGGDEPGTGDRNNLLANMILLIMSGLGIAGASLFRRRKEEN